MFVLLALSACDSSGIYASGERWTCPDGCNACTCVAADTISSTDMAC